MRLTRYIEKGKTYAEYFALIKRSSAQGQSTDGLRDEALVKYSELTLARTQRVIEFYTLSHVALMRELDNTKPQIWSVLSENQNPIRMQQYSTPGTESLPRLIAVDPGGEQAYFQWGPRPKPMQSLLAVYSADPKRGKAEYHVKRRRRCNSDAGRSLEGEIL